MTKKGNERNLVPFFITDTIMEKERFKKPSPEQLMKLAVVIHEKMNREVLVDMCTMTQILIDRLYDNGDLMIPSNKIVPVGFSLKGSHFLRALIRGLGEFTREDNTAVILTPQI